MQALPKRVLSQTLPERAFPQTQPKRALPQTQSRTNTTVCINQVVPTSRYMLKLSNRSFTRQESSGKANAEQTSSKP